MSADAHDAMQIEKRLKSAAANLHKLAGEVGTARQVIEYDSDRRKNLLARYMLPYLKDGLSAAAAEAYARSNPAYDEELQGYASQYELAQTTLRKWDAEYCSWESARSLMAMQRETLRNLPE